MPPGTENLLSPNWKRDISLFIGSQTVSLFGSSLVQYAITWHITLETQSGSMMTISIICAMLPTFIVSPLAGVWADRFDRKTLVILSDAVIALTTLAAAVAFFLGYREYWILFAILGIRAAGGGIQSPAAGALLPSLVPTERLMRVNGVFSSIQSAMMIVSPMASAALLALAPIEYIFFIDVGTAAIAIAILLFFLHIPAAERPAERAGTGYFHELREGFRYIKGHRFIMGFLAFMAAFLFLCAPSAFLPGLQVTRNYGPAVWRLTAIEIVFSAGMMAGGAVIAAWGGFRNRVYTMTLSLVLMGLCTIGLGVIPWFIPYLVVMGLYGVLMPLFNTPLTVILQEKVEDAFRGRVYSVLTMISTVMMPLGMIVFGPIADLVRIEYLLIGTGIVLTGISVLMGLNRTLVGEGLPLVTGAEGDARERLDR